MYHLKIKTTLLLPFWFGCLYFFFLPYCSDWDFQTVLNRHGEDNHFCLVPAFRGTAFNLSLLSRMLSVGLLYMILLCWVMFCLYASSWESLILKECCIFKCFVCTIEMKQLLTFTFIDLHILKNSYFTGINPIWLLIDDWLVIDLFNILLNSVC